MKSIFSIPIPSAGLALILGIAICATSTLINGDVAFFDSPIPILIGVLVTSTWWTILHAYHEAGRIRKEKFPDHTKRAAQRVVVALAFAFVPAVYLHDTWILTAIGAIYILSVFYFFFDGAVNRFLNRWIFYCPFGPKAAFSDNMWHKIPGKFRPFAMVLYKLTLLVVSGIVYSKYIR